MQKITPFIWYDTEAGEAARLNTSVFPDGRITGTTRIDNTPSGIVEIVSIELFGQAFTLMSAGPLYRVNPSISFLVLCRTAEEVDALWAGLSPGGTPLMALDSYPFSSHYGWIQDRYGVSWQVMTADGRPVMQRIIPTLMFVGAVCGKAEEAMHHYAGIFHDAHIDGIMRYTEGQEPDQAGTIVHAEFTLEGQTFAAMDSAHEHQFAFNEAVSLVVHCADQQEIDHYWALSADPAAEQCGWLKDHFGVSWQVVPDALLQMLHDADPQKVKRVTAAFMPMKKIDLAALERVYAGG